MAASDEVLRFKCRQCQAILRTSSARAGESVRCPQCQLMLVVPDRSLGDSEVSNEEEYQVWYGAGLPPSARRQYIAVICRLCRTRMYGELDQVGEPITCPDCGTDTTLREPPPAVPAKTLAPLGDEQGFHLQGDGDVYESEPLAAVICRLCHTRMYAPLDQVGQDVTCPDCGTLTEVPPPAPPKQRRGPVDDGSVIPLREGEAHSAKSLKAAYQHYVVVTCALCKTRMHATEDQIGEVLECPDCGTLMSVTGVERKRKRRLQLDDDGKPLETVPAEQAAGEDGAKPPAMVHEMSWYLPKDVVNEQRRPEPPRRPFLTGIVGFPFYRTSLACWLGLAAASSLTASLAIVAIREFSDILGSGGLAAGLGHAKIALPAAMIVSLVAAATIVIASVKFLTILLETSEGFDRIKNWPDGPWIDWVSESFYVISAAALCMTPGGLLYLLLAPRWEFAWTMFPLSAVLLFPVLLLSMLSAASPLAPLTATLLRMLVRMWWAWLLFFLQSTMAIVAAVAVTWGLVDRLDLLGVALACAIDVPLAMIYFRLLGRLALCCKQASVADIKRQAAAETS